LKLVLALIIFAGSLVSNSIPFVGVPYLLGVGIAVSRMSLWDATLTVLLSALGASIGKIIIYFLGRAFRFKIGEKSRQNLSAFSELFRRSIFIAIVVFAATPLPDDVLYIPLGISRYPLPLYFLAVFIGKVIMTAASCIYLGAAARLVESMLERNIFVGVGIGAALTAVTAYLIYIIMKVDWVEVANVFKDRGWREGIVFLIKEVVSVTRGALGKLGRERCCVKE